MHYNNPPTRIEHVFVRSGEVSPNQANGGIQHQQPVVQLSIKETRRHGGALMLDEVATTLPSIKPKQLTLGGRLNAG